MLSCKITFNPDFKGFNSDFNRQQIHSEVKKIKIINNNKKISKPKTYMSTLYKQRFLINCIIWMV